MGSANRGNVHGVETILTGYDGTRSAERALERTAELAKALGSKVVVVSVASLDPVAPVGAFGLMPYYDMGAIATGARLDEERWRQHREHVEAYFAKASVEVEFASASGNPVEEIVDVARQHRADLIVVGTRSPGLLERLLGGSVSQGVARRAECDVLIVHSPDADED